MKKITALLLALMMLALASLPAAESRRIPEKPAN